MSGFKNQQLNDIAKADMLENIIDFLFISLEQMKNDLLLLNKKLKNDENKIRNHLLENYLNDEGFRRKINYDNYPLVFEAEAQEGYDKESDKYKGRVDIKVISINTLKSYGKDYYIIECKRLDGSGRLNDEFVKEGIYRFVLDEPKYSSYNGSNIMLGFMVKDVDVDSNMYKINQIQNAGNDKFVKEFRKCKSVKDEYYLYKNKYRCKDTEIELDRKSVV